MRDDSLYVGFLRNGLPIIITRPIAISRALSSTYAVRAERRTRIYTFRRRRARVIYELSNATSKQVFRYSAASFRQNGKEMNLSLSLSRERSGFEALPLIYTI